MATVYLAHDDELDRPVAIKLLAEHLAGDAAFRKRFLREARLAARLSHPNVVSVYDAGEAEDGRPYIVMEYVDGDDARRAAASVAPGRGGRARAPGLPRPRARPRRRARPPRREAAEPAPARGRDGQGRRLRDRAGGRGDRAHPGRHGARHGGLPLARAGARRGGDGGRGRLLARRRALRAADRAAAVRVRLARRPRGPAGLGQIAPVGELAPDVPRRVEDAVMRSLARNPAYRPASAAALARELGADEPSRRRPLAPAASGTPQPPAAGWLARRRRARAIGRGRRSESSSPRAATAQARHRAAAAPSSGRSRAARTPRSRRGTRGLAAG